MAAAVPALGPALRLALGPALHLALGPALRLALGPALRPARRSAARLGVARCLAGAQNAEQPLRGSRHRMLPFMHV